MAILKCKTNGQEDSSKNGAISDYTINVLEIIWKLIFAVLIILIWFYSGKDYDDEATPQNIAIIGRQTEDIK